MTVKYYLSERTLKIRQRKSIFICVDLTDYILKSEDAYILNAFSDIAEEVDKNILSQYHLIEVEFPEKLKGKVNKQFALWYQLAPYFEDENVLLFQCKYSPEITIYTI